ncbi:MAG TPA: hypothetical protein VJ795_15025, partial [Rheinheimera sp.]|uniref:hypothetical protein n=1 Tax=Rheinheimera sp. TaxID=1869214 RepID=UPI002B494BFA
MQTNELYTLALWYENNIDQDPVVSHYTKLHSILQKTTSNLTAENLNSANNAKREYYELIVERLNLVAAEKLTDTQKDILIHMGLQSLILSPAKEYLSSLLLLSHDYPYILNTLKSGNDRLTQASSSFRAFRVQMQKILPPKYLETPTIHQNKCLTRLTFHNEASINNIVNLKDWSKSWFTIARGFSMAVNQAPEDFELISADKGSLIVDLMLNIEVVKLITETITSLAELATQLISLKMAIEGIKELKDKMDKSTYEQMLKQVTKSVSEDEEQIINKVIDRLKGQGLLKNENCKNELNSAIKELIKYNQKGGSINCITH